MSKDDAQNGVVARVRRAFKRTSADVLTVQLSVAVLAIAVLAASFVKVPDTLATGLFGGPALVLGIVLMRRLRFNNWTIGVIVGGLILYVLYFGYTAFGERNYDGPEQLNYVKFVVEKGALPEAKECFVCHHPPAYYLLAAGAFKFAQLTDLTSTTRIVQLTSLLLSFLFIVFGTLIVRRFTERKTIETLAVAFIVLWPYSIVNSVRFHNDVMVGTTMVASLFYLVKWYQDERPRDIWIACVLAALSVLTKSNGYAIVATIGAVGLCQLLLSSTRLQLLKKGAAPVLVMTAALGAYALLRGPSGDGAEIGEKVLGGAYNIGVHDYVDNEPQNFMYFDLESFLKEPYLLSRFDGSGRQYFWNHLVKSSLFGTHNDFADLETSYRFNRRIAEVMNFVVLGLLAYTAGAVLSASRRAMRRYLPLALFASICVLSVLAFKAIVPSAHHNDFRFAYPIVVCVSLAFALATDKLGRHGAILGYLGRAAGMGFLALSVIYYLPKYDLIVRYLPKKVLRVNGTQLRTVQPEKKDWNKAPNIVFQGDERLEVSFREKDVKLVDVTLDGNDRYEIEIFGAEETRRIRLGPAKKPPGFKGLAHYRHEIEPPVKKMRAIRVSAVSGDRAYSVGHLITD